MCFRLSVHMDQRLDRLLIVFLRDDLRIPDLIDKRWNSAIASSLSSYKQTTAAHNDPIPYRMLCTSETIRPPAPRVPVIDMPMLWVAGLDANRRDAKP